MAALRTAVFPLFAKNRRGGHFLPPPSSARVKKSQAASGPVSIWMGDRLECFERQR